MLTLKCIKDKNNNSSSQWPKIELFLVYMSGHFQ